MMQRLNDIKLKIASGKLKEAIQGFLAIAKQANVEHYNSAVLLSLSYHFYQNCHAKGLMSEDAERHFLQIAHRLLLMVDEVSES